MPKISPQSNDMIDGAVECESNVIFKTAFCLPPSGQTAQVETNTKLKRPLNPLVQQMVERGMQ